MRLRVARWWYRRDTFAVPNLFGGVTGAAAFWLPLWRQVAELGLR